MENKTTPEYLISIDPGILEFLGQSLYTNIYYVLAELIANAYDANAKNVYILEKDKEIIVEDDGRGMSYKNGDTAKYLNVAIETRVSSKDTFVDGSNKKRKKIGRKGIGKLAALAVSEKVLIKTIKDGEKSGFILSRHVNDDRKLEPLKEEEIKFERVKVKSGTSVVMTQPNYDLHKTPEVIKKNILKIFPLVDKNFKIHIETKDSKITVDNFDKEIVKELGALITIGEDYIYLSKYFNSGFNKGKEFEKKFLKNREKEVIKLNLKNNNGVERAYDLKIRGWIGAYQSTRDRKMDRNDFPDNFISLLSNGKLGEYNIIPIVGKNRLVEVYIVGQLHVDLFEETELPDMALSNRQGYKSDDKRYKAVIEYVSKNLLPEITNLRSDWAAEKKKDKDKEKIKRQKEMEAELREKVEKYKTKASEQAAKRISNKISDEKDITKVINSEMNALLPIVGLKNKIDSNKKRILISHTSVDKSLADVVCKMLLFNNIPAQDIIYTNSDDPECRIPEGKDVFDYLRHFFVDSYSDQKIFIVYVTSDDMAKSWFAVTEVGAGWITQSDHKIFNIHSHIPLKPLDTGKEWQTSKIKNGNITMNSKEFDKFIEKILDVCKQLGYTPRKKIDNQIELKRYVTIK